MVLNPLCILNHVNKEHLSDSSCIDISWAAYYAHKPETKIVNAADSTGMMPLFKEQAHSPAMIKHSMTIIQKAMKMVNHNQVPVIAFDQPLYAFSMQWIWPDTYGDEKFVIMFGGLHIELTALKALGKWLDSSGLVNAITQSGIASSGTADSFLKASHITRTRHAHKVTAASLHIL